jgi:hypothetical protein
MSKKVAYLARATEDWVAKAGTAREPPCHSERP